MKRGIIKIVIAGVIVLAAAVAVTVTVQGRGRRQAEVAQGVEVLKKMESADVKICHQHCTMPLKN